MTKRRFQRIQCRLRRGVNGLYYSYLESVLRGLNLDDVDRVLATVPRRQLRDRKGAIVRPSRSTVMQRELKLRGDLGCARVRERLWQLQHLQFDLPPAGERARCGAAAG